MINFIKNEFFKTVKYIKENILKLTIISGIAFLIIAVASFFLIKLIPEEELLAVFKEISAMFDTKGVVNEDGSISAFGLFINNTRAMFIAVVLGMIPFVFWPFFTLFLNSSLVGVVVGIFDATTDYNIFYLILTKLLPHGIFELPALFVSTAMGIKLCIISSKKIIGKKDLSLKYHLINCLRVFLFIIIPFLILAAIIESSL